MVFLEGRPSSIEGGFIQRLEITGRHVLRNSSPWLPSGADTGDGRNPGSPHFLCPVCSCTVHSQAVSALELRMELWAQMPVPLPFYPALDMTSSSQKHLPHWEIPCGHDIFLHGILVSVTVSQPFNVCSISGITQCVCSKSSVSIEWWVSRMSSLWSDPSQPLQ